MPVLEALKNSVAVHAEAHNKLINRNRLALHFVLFGVVGPHRDDVAIPNEAPRFGARDHRFGSRRGREADEERSIQYVDSLGGVPTGDRLSAQSSSASFSRGLFGPGSSHTRPPGSTSIDQVIESVFHLAAPAQGTFPEHSRSSDPCYERSGANAWRKSSSESLTRTTASGRPSSSWSQNQTEPNSSRR
jgi:hypothetical protein